MANIGRGVKISGGGGNSVGSRGMNEGPARVQLKDLPVEQQHAHEILAALAELNEMQMRTRIVSTAGANEPVGAIGLRLVAELYEAIGMPLSVAGVQRFKLDRGLHQGTLGGAVAKAYARALDGDEILIRVDRREEAQLKPSELACLRFLREMQKKTKAAELTPLKKALHLGNPAMSATAKKLQNEYVGLSTVIEIEHAATMNNITLSRDGIKRLAAVLASADKGTDE
ncbi:MAG TPA: hypothetical protein VGO62_18345 [Myxococcota bacterium]|jgi:hypothetical protein